LKTRVSDMTRSDRQIPMRPFTDNASADLKSSERFRSNLPRIVRNSVAILACWESKSGAGQAANGDSRLHREEARPIWHPRRPITMIGGGWPGRPPEVPSPARHMTRPSHDTIRAAAESPGQPRLADDERKRRDPGLPGTAVIAKTKPQTKRPNLYRVLILNDDYTPMEFVVHVLERFFNKDHEAATRVMLHVHHHGIGECGIYTYEVAETKVTQVMDFARKHQHPLQCVMEKK